MSKKIFEPGMYDISNEEYHASAGISRSMVATMRESMLHYWDRYVNPYAEKEETSDLSFGGAFHPYVLERQLFSDSYYVYRHRPLNTKDGKEHYKKHQQLAGKKELIRYDDFSRMMRMKKSMMRDQEITDLIRGGKYEKSLYWIDDDTGLLLKCRPDIIHLNMLADIKTSKSAKGYSFRYAVEQYSYDIQAAMMIDAIKKLFNKTIEEFYFIVVEKERPFCTAIYLLHPESIEKARTTYKNLLFKYKECLEKDKWPGYPSKIIISPNKEVA